MEEVYNIKIPVFEGPFDLLLHLIKEAKIDIYDIPISRITSQYLQYIEMMKELDLEIAGDFLVMASTLIHIKSRMLLPPDEDVPLDEQEDPRLELVQKLLEYQTFKEAASTLREKEEEWKKVFSKEPLTDDGEELYLVDVNLFDLMGAFKKLLETTSPDIVMITKETLTVKDRMSVIMEIIEGHEAIRFEEIFKGSKTRIQLIVTFVALLELIRLGLAKAYQEKQFGNIWIINPSKQSDVVSESSNE
jgi:segregation and condensation protein A